MLGATGELEVQDLTIPSLLWRLVEDDCGDAIVQAEARHIRLSDLQSRRAVPGCTNSNAPNR